MTPSTAPQPSATAVVEHSDAAPTPFPLPLTPFESFMLLDVRPGYSLTYFIELVFEGSPRRSALERAIRMAVARNGMLEACVEGPPSRWAWVRSTRPVPIEWAVEDGGSEPSFPDGIDLRTEPGLRVRIVERDDGASVWLQLHHASTDGQGARRFIFDLLTGYARECAADAPEPDWDPLDPSILPRRSEVRRPDTEGLGWWGGIREAWKLCLRSAVPLAAPSPESPSHENHPPRILQSHFDDEQTQRLRERARQQGARLNDVALGLLFDTMARWNVARDDSARKRFLRILIPTDLRDKRDAQLPASNRLGFAFMTRPVSACEDWDNLLPGITSEMEFVNRHRPGWDFLHYLGLARRVPGLLETLLKRMPCFATAVLTNLHDPGRWLRRRFPSDNGNLQVGDIRLTRVSAVPPVRPGTRVGVGLCRFGGRLTISILYDPLVFDEETSREFQGAFIERWHDWGELR